MHAQLVAGDHLDQALLLRRSLVPGGSGPLFKCKPYQQHHDDLRRARMAAVMMRAIGVKSSSSSSSAAAGGGSGSSTTATGEQWDGQSLARQTSRLCPPNPALVPGQKLGILIKSVLHPLPFPGVLCRGWVYGGDWVSIGTCDWVTQSDWLVLAGAGWLPVVRVADDGRLAPERGVDSTRLHHDSTNVEPLTRHVDDQDHTSSVVFVDRLQGTTYMRVPSTVKYDLHHGALRPPSSETVYALNASAGSASTSSLSDGAAILAPAQLNPSLALSTLGSSAVGAEFRPSVSLPASALNGSQDRDRSVSREATTTASRPSSGTRNKSDVTDTGNTGGSGPKIRFAPLPEIRQRSHSTGRNIWLADGGSDPGDSSRRDIVIRRDGDTGPLDDSALYDDDDDCDLSDDDCKPAKTMFGSWKTDLTFGVIPSSSSSASRSGQGDESSYSKLLRPLSFGMVGKKEKKKQASSVDGQSSSLSRTSSNDSDVSRGTSVGSYEGRGTGIPMRKTATWESGDSIGASPAREPRRANYPPVAQRSRNRASQVLPLSISAPEFNEWGTAGSVGSFTSKLSTSTADDDDGGGMAWIKKRRAQREAEAKRKAEEEEAERRRLEEQEAEEATNGLEDEGVDEPGLADTMELDDGQDGTTLGIETPTASTPKKTLQLGNITNHIAASQRREDSSRGLLSATTPKVSEAPQMENGTVDQVIEIAPPSAERSGSPEPLATTIAQPTPVSPTAAKMAALSLQNSDSDDDDDDDDVDDEEEGDSQRGDDDTDSDLDEEELAKEEALVEEARVTAKSAGAERYHSASHQSAVLTPHTRSGSSAGHVSSVPGSRIPTPSRQSTLTQADAGALPIVGGGRSRAATPSRQATITQANFDDLVQQ
ncbi:BQ2448_5608 [Microbotryum intermedium]|uniref:BQ2448_5608 protein n=1 Tax=Microbotryum intermedium TaxID=269621 RepID=A0A238EYJ5_9BASI|nr:BQ2448_5608 [Microbotryum intermedium]